MGSAGEGSSKVTQLMRPRIRTMRVGGFCCCFVLFFCSASTRYWVDFSKHPRLGGVF